jgi:hypothetical protein
MPSVYFPMMRLWPKPNSGSKMGQTRGEKKKESRIHARGTRVVNEAIGPVEVVIQMLNFKAIWGPRGKGEKETSTSPKSRRVIETFGIFFADVLVRAGWASLLTV